MPPTGTVRVANWTIQWNLKRLRCVDMSSDGLWREIALQNLEARCEAAGQWRLPCVSAALEHYVSNGSSAGLPISANLFNSTRLHN